MNSHAHVILELPAPKEVSMIWDLNLSGSSPARIFHVSPGVGNVSRPPLRRLIDVLPLLFSLPRLAAPLYRYIALALHSTPWSSKFTSRGSRLQYDN